jgi:Calcium-dependent channel, 7TM region, putative phosphate
VRSNNFFCFLVFWDNIGRSHKDIQIGKLISTAGTVALCLLWTIPMSTISTMSNVDELKKNVEFVANMIEAVPIIEPILQQLAPLFLIMVNSLLPSILQFLSMREGPVSTSVVEASLFTKLAAFSIIQTFFVSLLSGGIISGT